MCMEKWEELLDVYGEVGRVNSCVWLSGQSYLMCLVKWAELLNMFAEVSRLT